MINTEFFDLLIEHILKLYDENNEEIKFNKITYKFEKRKFSSVTSLVIYVDNISLTVKQYRSYFILYKCRCGREHKILLQKYFLKTKLHCINCCQDRYFDDYVIANYKGKVKKNKQVILKPFDEYDNEFKENYKRNHLSSEEFKKYLPYIYKINNHLITKDILNNIIYYYTEHTNNQFKFTSKISFDNGITKETIKYIFLKCNTCGRIFKIHTNNIRLQDLSNIQCRKCKLVNTTYPIRKYENTNITYQSGIEKVFIDFCISNNIKIENGKEITYNFDNKVRTYITDFYLPQFKYIIELKAKNKFYRDDLKSGKIEAKNNACIDYCNKNNLYFKFVFDYELNEFNQKLLNERDSLEE